MRRLDNAPTTASTSRTTPIQCSCRKNRNDITPPDTVPTITAKNDSDSRMPLPLLSKCGGISSGMIPYFAGPKKAACMPMRNTQPSTTHGPHAFPYDPIQKPRSATAHIATSANFQITSADRFEYLSAA